MNQQHLRPCIGGWLLIAGGALPALQSIITFLFNFIIRGMPIRYMTEILGYSFLPNIIFGLPLIALGAVLVMKKQGIPVAIVCGCGVLVELVYPLLSTLLARWFGLAFIGATHLNFFNILHALVFVLLALIALTVVSQQATGFKKLWWLPAAVYGCLEFFYFISDLVYIIRDHAISFRNIFDTVLYLIFGLVAVAGFFFAGQWLADPLRKKPIYRPAPQTPQGNSYQQPQYTNYQQPVQPQYQQPVQPKPAATSVVEELERAKRLLDSGAITQEEYEQLKKRLLH